MPSVIGLVKGALGGLGFLPQALSASASYDYVIVGGGTAGMVLANRLSADLTTTVLVVEAGTDQRNNPAVTNAGGFGQALRTAVDWTYYSVPQTQMAGQTIKFSAGKGLGGSTLINGMIFVRGDKAQFDSWSQYGNTGWDWNGLYTASKQLETLIKPTNAQSSAGASYTNGYHGTSGELLTGFPDQFIPQPFFQVVNETWNDLGLKHLTDPNGGNVRGFSTHPNTIDPRKNYRWDAANAFLWPIVDSRPNLKIVQGQVSRVLWKSGSVSGNKVASGVYYHYTTSTGAAATASIAANKEVILSAGAIKTPVILEHSGVGNATYLQNNGIASVIDLPGVGLTHNDQVNNAIGWKGGFGSAAVNGSILTTFVNMKDIFGSQFNAVNASTYQAIPQWAAQLSGGDPEVATALQSILTIQHGVIFKNLVTIGEILTIGSSTGASVNYWQLMPFSRGSVHQAGKNDYQNAVIDPAFFAIDFDIQVQMALGQYAYKLWQTSPADQYAQGGRNKPTLDQLPQNPTTDQWNSFHLSTAGTPDHSMGTAAMRSKSLLGVVDSNLLVYGTSNVRVVDASVIPQQFSGHTSWVVYAIAQKASQIILG